MSEHIERPVRSHSITATLTVNDAARAIDFYIMVFGAEELVRMPGPGGRGIIHAELRFGDSILFLNDEFPGMGTRSPQALGGATGGIYLSVEDVDAVFKRALEAGAQEDMAPQDMFWGDRMGSIIDPFGHHWSIGTHKRDVSPEEMRRGAEEFFGDGCSE